MDKALASEAVCLVGPRLERRGKCAALGDMKDMARGNPLGIARVASYSAAVTSDLVLS